MAQKKKIVLFVDDDLNLLELIQQLMGHYAGDQWEILTAPDVSKALGILQERRVDLLVFDIRMPVVDGVQFVKLLQRKFPNLLKVVLTGFASEETRAACLNNGAELYLEKPADPGGWQGIHATLHELARFQPEEGFRGVLRQVGLQDVLQMECLARHSVVLQVRAAGLEGHVFVHEGQIIHADFGDQRGLEAFNQILSLAGGEFDLGPFSEPPERSISGSWEFLLMEAARQRDEVRKDTSAAEPEPDPGPLVIPDFFAPPPRSAAVPGASPDGPPAHDPFQPALSPARTAASSAAVPPDASVLRPRTEELLVCSMHGEVWHAWQCANANGRVSFLEFVSQKARLMAEALPLGSFDRLEVNALNTRTIAQLQADRALFVRASRAPEPASPRRQP